MTDPTPDPKVRYPEMEVSEGQKHGYVGDVEVVPADTGIPSEGSSNVEPEKPAEETSDTRTRRVVR